MNVLHKRSKLIRKYYREYARARRATKAGHSRMLEIQRKYNHSKKGKAYYKKYHTSETSKKVARIYRASEKGKLTVRDAMLRRKYGITLETYAAMFKHGSGKCWICKRKAKPGKSFNVDHQHLTKDQKKAGLVFGKVRGLLCFYCNKYVIGRRKAQHAYVFENAASYLRAEKDWRLHGTTE